MLGSVPSISKTAAYSSTPFSLSTRPPLHTPSAVSATPACHSSTQLFSSPSYIPSTTKKAVHSLSQTGIGGFSRSVADTQEKSVGGCDSDGPLFSHPLSVVVQVGEEEKIHQLVVTVSTNLVNGLQSRFINIVITDTKDHFFYFSLSLFEEDFINLRSQQGLLVDFASFPSMVVQLLEKCLAEGQTSQPQFVLVLNCSKPQPCLEFTELNMFKHLVHLSLVVLRATDTQLKDYLVSSITALTKEKEHQTTEMHKIVETLQQQLSDRSELLQKTSVKLENFKVEQGEQASSLEQRLAKEVEEVKEKASKQIQELQWKVEREKKEAEYKNARIIQQLENRVASLDVQNRDLVEIRYRHEASLREARGQLNSKEEEIGRLKVDILNVRKEKESLESTSGDRERRANQVSTRLAAVEQELVDKEGHVRHQQVLFRQGEEARDRLALEVEEKSRLVEKRETIVKTVTGELLKANEIIRKLQEGVKQEQGKVRLRGQIATEQERLLRERDKEMGQCREELKDGKESMLMINSKMVEIEKKLEVKESKILELEKVLKTNENVINWLNKQISTQPVSPFNDLLPKTVAVVVGNRAGANLGAGVARRRVKTVTDPSPAVDEVVTELDPKYFSHSTPGGSHVRQQIPTDLPDNVVRRGAGGLLRRAR